MSMVFSNQWRSLRSDLYFSLPWDYGHFVPANGYANIKPFSLVNFHLTGIVLAGSLMATEV